MARGTKRRLLDLTRMVAKERVLACSMFTAYLAHLQGNPGWFAINVLVPVLLPFAVIAAVAVATGGWREFVQMLKKAVDNGQLFWVALAMLASTGNYMDLRTMTAGMCYYYPLLHFNLHLC